MQNTVIIDVNNILFMCSYESKTTDENTLALSFYLKTQEYASNLKANNIIYCFESGTNWRKIYTLENQLIKQYKANRNRYRDNGLKELVYRASDIVYETLTNMNLICLKLPMFEGDDVIAESAIKLSEKLHNVFIISNDNDFSQLLKFKNINIYDPTKSKCKVCEDPLYFMFEKCIRGDQGDNVQSAYPRLRSTKIEEAYHNKDKLLEIMNNTFKNPLTGDMESTSVYFEHNKRLMDLTYQPDKYREILNDYVNRELEKESKVLNNIQIKRLVASFNVAKKNKSVDLISKIKNNRFNEDK